MNNGTVGEQYFETVVAVAMGWHMTRTQPAMRCVGVDKRKRPIYQPIAGAVSPADYTGYYGLFDFIACEVKEAQGDSMPNSRLKDQREYMDKLPRFSAKVCIFWLRTNKAEIFHYQKGRGSYTRGLGIRTI